MIMYLIAYLLYDHFLVPSILVDNEKKVWVYVEITVEQKRDTSDYYYYGQILENLFEEIQNERIENKYFELSNIRFWNDDDLLELLENDDRFDNKIFRMNDISYLTAYKKDPILIYDEEELAENTQSN
ncbi:MAG: hypothetical protein R2728_13640 [Chitinophagales bacterium]